MTPQKNAICFVKYAFPTGDSGQDSIIVTPQPEKKAIAVCEETGYSFFFIVSPFPPSNYKDLTVYLKNSKNTSVEAASLAGYNILLRSSVEGIYFALGAILEHQGKSELTADEYRAVLNWADHVSSRYTSRKITRATFSELENKLHEHVVNGMVFIKTEDKVKPGHGLVITAGSVLDAYKKGQVPHLSKATNKVELLDISPNTKIMLAQPISLKTDDKGTLEYRTWVFNNKPIATTRYTFETPIRNDKINEFITHFVQDHRTKLPNHYVVDVGITDSGPVVIELNDITSSGRLGKTIFRRILKSYMSNA